MENWSKLSRYRLSSESYDPLSSHDLYFCINRLSNDHVTIWGPLKVMHFTWIRSISSVLQLYGVFLAHCVAAFLPIRFTLAALVLHRSIFLITVKTSSSLQTERPIQRRPGGSIWALSNWLTFPSGASREWTKPPKKEKKIILDLIHQVIGNLYSKVDTFTYLSSVAVCSCHRPAAKKPSYCRFKISVVVDLSSKHFPSTYFVINMVK